jgi:hypothetical protein
MSLIKNIEQLRKEHKTFIFEDLKYFFQNYNDENDRYTSLETHTHMDTFIGKRTSKIYLVEGIKLFKIFIEVCRENNWFHKFNRIFEPTFYITLKRRKQVNNLDIDNLTIESLSKKVDNHCPPELSLNIGMDKIRKKSNYGIGEWYDFTLPNSTLERIFMEEFNSKFYAEYGCWKDEEELIINDDLYNCYLYIRYRNEK